MLGIYHPGICRRYTTLGICTPYHPGYTRPPATHCCTHRTGQHRGNALTALAHRVAELNISETGVSVTGVTGKREEEKREKDTVAQSAPHSLGESVGNSAQSLLLSSCSPLTVVRTSLTPLISPLCTHLSHTSHLTVVHTPPSLSSPLCTSLLPFSPLCTSSSLLTVVHIPLSPPLCSGINLSFSPFVKKLSEGGETSLLVKTVRKRETLGETGRNTRVNREGNREEYPGF